MPTPAGGPTDITARMLADPLGKILGNPVVVDHRGGANGNIAGQLVARGPPDGSSLAAAVLGLPVHHAAAVQPVSGFDPGKNRHRSAT